MKNNLVFLSILVCSTIVFGGCSKEDTEAPVIQLIGGDVTLDIGESFTDPGFTATDDEDGDLSSLVDVDLSDLNINLAGTYLVSYSVADEAGNIGSTERTVIVRNSLEEYNIDGIWSVSESCGGTPTSYQDTISLSNTVDGRIIFKRFGNYINGFVYADVLNITSSGATISIPSQNIVCGQAPAPTRTFSANGTLNLISNTMSIPYQEVTNGSTTNCTGNYSR